MTFDLSELHLECRPLREIFEKSLDTIYIHGPSEKTMMISSNIEPCLKNVSRANEDRSETKTDRCYLI